MEGYGLKENALQSVIGSLGLRWLVDEDIHQEDQGILSLIEDARREWLQARAYFDSVLEPDLVEHAVYVSKAAETRYMYLLKQAREQGLKSQYPLRIE
jgi:hypothetical protein